MNLRPLRRPTLPGSGPNSPSADGTPAAGSLLSPETPEPRSPDGQRATTEQLFKPKLKPRV